MKPEKPKLLRGLFLVSLIGFTLLLSLCIFYLGKGAYHGIFRPEHLSFSLTTSEGAVILSDERAERLQQGEHLLILKNSSKEDVSYVLYQDGKVKGKLSLEAGKQEQISMDSDGGAISVLAQSDRISVAYLSDEKSFLDIHPIMEQGGELVFLTHTALKTVQLKSIFRLYGDFSFEELSLECEGKGEIVLFPKKTFSADLYVFAPSSRIYLKNFQCTFDKTNRDFYLKAKSVNDKALSLSDYPVSSYDDLFRLASEEHLPRLIDGGVLQFRNEFAVENSLSFSALAKMEFSAPVSFGENTLTFFSEKEGAYEVYTARGTGIDGASLLFEAPKATLLWTGDGTIPALSTVTKGSNVKLYNGAKPPLGGEGEAIPKLTVYADSSEHLSEDVVFQVKGNLLVASLPYLISQDSLSDANFALSCDNGKAALDGSISDGVIVTTDSMGAQRRFAVEVLRDPYQIPVVHLQTDGGAEITSKSQYVSATFSMDGSGSSYDSLGETHIRIRGRGNSTWKWDKKPYKIHFDEPTSILGLPAAEEWALFSNYADKSLMRNRLAQVMASKLSFAYCPTQVCVDVFLNGEYLGVYTLGEHLEAGDGRVEVDYDMSQTDCGYFLEAGGVVSGVDVKGMNYFHAGLVKFVLIKTPEYNTLTSEQFEFIHQYMLAADEAVKKGEGYEEYLDVDSVVDWLIMIELSCNTDCSWRRSTYFTKQPGGKLVMGPVWDFDLAFGNFSKDNFGDDTWVSSEPDDDYVGETWSTYLLEDPEFKARFKARWLEVRDTLVNTAIDEIEQQYLLLEPSAEQNFFRWDILGKKVAFERHDTKNYRTYSSQINYLQDFITARAEWLDDQVANW